MLPYIIRRLLIAIPVLLAITFINFALIHLAPGNPVIFMMMQAGQTGQMTGQQVMDQYSNLSGDFLKQREHELGLDKPLLVQYVDWLGQIAHGDLGRSMINGDEIGPIMLLRLPVTLQLTVTSLLISVLIGVTLGTLTALHQYSWLDQVVSFLSYIGMSVPGFLLALLAISVVALHLEWLPAGRMYDAATGGTFSDRLVHMILPVLVIGISGSVGIIRYTRTSVLEVMREDYVAVARAKGLTEAVIQLRHILRNALVPVLTVIGHEIPNLLGGAALYETIFLWPGLGQWAATAAASHDFSIMMVVISVTAALIVLSNLLIDIVYAIVDPRISYS
jgi:peptide/nickel transport system permease protein